MAEPVDPLAAAWRLVERPIAYKVHALCSSPRSLPDSSRQPPTDPPPSVWRRTEELNYIGRESDEAVHWTDYRIVSFLARTAITIPPKSENRADPWVTVTQADGTTTTLPRGYRIPLLWLHRVQWESLRLLLSVGKAVWPWLRFDLLHIGRLTDDFLERARAETKMKRQWRYPRFDRPLTRFFNGWMGCREVFIWDFYEEFKDLEYNDDVLSLRWAQKVPKGTGIQGFVVTDQELLDGISKEQFMDGLVIDDVNRTVEWDVPPEPELPPSPMQPSPVSRGSSPLTSDMGSERELDLVAQALNPKASEPSTPTPGSQSATPGPSRLPPIPLAIQTELPPPRKKPPPKPRPPRSEKAASTRPLRPRTQGGSVSSPAVAPHLGSASATNSPGSAVQFDFTAPVESRGRKRKIENVYSASASPSPLTSDEEEDDSGSYKGSSYKGSRTTGSVSRSQSQSQTPGGRAFSTQSRIVIPRLSSNNHDVYSRPLTEAYTGRNGGNDNINPMMSSASRGPPTISGPTTSTAGLASISAAPLISSSSNHLSRKPSITLSEPTSPRKSSSSHHRDRPSSSAASGGPPLTLLQQRHFKLSAIASSPSPAPFDPRTGDLPPLSTWRHAEELDYIGPNHPSVLGGEWSDWQIVDYMVTNVFTIPSRAVDNKQTWVEVRMVNMPPATATHDVEDGEKNDMAVDKDPSNGYVLNLPRGYRIPLLWLAQVQWDCLKYLVTQAPEYWQELKFDVLHIARLLGVFLAKARKEPRIKRGYRDVMFDRPLSRFFTGWMGSRDEFVYDFFREFKEEEYEDDMLSKRWLQKVQKGIQGYTLTEEELNAGLTAEQYMRGLELDRENKTFAWVVDGQKYSLPAAGTASASANAPALTLTTQVPAAPTAIEDEPMQVEETQPVQRQKSPLSLTQVAEVHSPSLSPLTPTMVLLSENRLGLMESENGDIAMDVDKEDVDVVPNGTVAELEDERPPADPSALEKPPSLFFDEPDVEQEKVVMTPEEERPPATSALGDPRTLFDDPTPEPSPEPERLPEPATTVADSHLLFDSPSPSAPVATTMEMEQAEADVFDPLFDEEESEAVVVELEVASEPPVSQDESAGDFVATRDVPEVQPQPTVIPPVNDQITQGDVSQTQSDIGNTTYDLFGSSPPVVPIASPGDDDDDLQFELHYPPSSPGKPDVARDLFGSSDISDPSALPPVDDVEFNESDFLTSRLPTPFASTPPPASITHLPSVASQTSPLADPPALTTSDAESSDAEMEYHFVERAVLVLPPRPVSFDQDDSESIRSSSSPEPRRAPTLPPPEPTRGPPSPPVSTSHEQHSPAASAEEHHASPPPDSEIDEDEPIAQDIPVQAVASATEPPQPIPVAADDPGPDAVELEEDELEDDAPPGPVTAAHILPIGASDAADEFPPGFHFMGSLPHETNGKVDVGQTQFVPTPATAAISVPRPASEPLRDPTPPIPVDLPSLETPLELSADVDDLPSPSPVPEEVEAETAEIAISRLPDAESKQVKLEIMTESLPNGADDEREEEEPVDMDIGTPIHSPVEMETEAQIPDAPPVFAADEREEPPTAQIDSPQRSPPPRSDIGLFVGANAPPVVSEPTPPPPPPPPPFNDYSRPGFGVTVPPPSSDRSFFSGKSNNSNFSPYGRNSSYRRSPPPRSSGGHRPFFSKAGQNFSKSNSSRSELSPFGNSAPRSKLFSRDREGGGVPPPLPQHPPHRDSHRQDHPMDGRRSPIRIPDSDSEYDPRRPSVYTIQPSSLPSPGLPPMAYPRWMSYSGPGDESSAYHQPYSPLVSLNNSMASSSPHIPHAAHAPAADPVSSRPVGSSSDVPLYNGQMPMPIAMPSANRPPSPLRSSSSHDTVLSLPSKPPTPPVHMALTSADALRNLLAQVAPEVLRGSQLVPVPPPEIEMGDMSPQRPSTPPPVPLPTPPLPSSTTVAPHSPPSEPFHSPTPPPPSPPPPPLEAPRVPEIDLKSLENTLLERLTVDMESRETSLSERLEADIQSREKTLMEKLKSELRLQLKDELALELKNEMRDHLKEEMRGAIGAELKSEMNGALHSELKGALFLELHGQLKDELKDELKDALTVQLRGELVAQMQEQLPGRVKEEVFGELKSELLLQMTNDLLEPLKDDLFTPLKAQLTTDLKTELVDQLRDELFVRLKDDLVLKLQEELRTLLQDDLKERLQADLSAALESNLRNVLRDDLKEHILTELKAHFSSQLQEQLKALGEQLQNALNSQLRDDLTIQMKYFVAKLKEDLILQLKDTLTVHLQDGMLTQVKAALTAQLRDGLGAQREQLNLDFERRRLFLEQQPRVKAIAAAKPSSPAASSPARPSPLTPKPVPAAIFQVRHPLHHLVLTPDGMDVESSVFRAPPTPPVTVSAPGSAQTSPSKPKSTASTTDAPVPVKSQRKQSWFTAGISASSPA